MNLLFIDSETTGLADFNKRASDPSQPHIVSFAGLLTDGDGVEIETVQHTVKPEGWTIPEDAARVHGITTEAASIVGIPEAQVAAEALRLIRAADLMVAFNLMFDKFICRIALRRFGLLEDVHDLWWKSLPGHCVMKAMTPVCELPGPRGFKYPKLGEAYQHAFGRNLEGAHGAFADATACKELFFWMKRREAA